MLECIVKGSAEPTGLQLPHPVRRLDRRRVLPLAAVLVVLLVAAGVTLVHTIGGDNRSQRAGGPAAIAQTTSHAQGRSSAANKTAALAAVDYLLAAVPVLPGARRVSSLAHVPFLLSRSGSPNVVEKSAFWTASGTMGAAIAYVRAHLPDGWTIAGTGSSGGFHGRTTSEALTLDVPSPGSSGAYTQLQVQVAVAPYQGGVAMTGDVEAIWLPARTRAEQIPAAAGSVDVSIVRPGLGTVRRTLTGKALHHLADVVNTQPVATPLGSVHCPMGTGRSEDALTFHAPGAAITVTAWRNGCTGVTVTADGKAQPALTGVNTIDAAVIKALGLPATYRMG